MNDEQKAAARERMAKARAVMLENRKNRATTEKELPVVRVDNEPDLVLTIRRLHVGSFAGLWELGRVMPDGSIKVLTDANTKSIVINMARNEILGLL